MCIAHVEIIFHVQNVKNAFWKIVYSSENDFQVFISTTMGINKQTNTVLPKWVVGGEFCDYVRKIFKQPAEIIF